MPPKRGAVKRPAAAVAADAAAPVVAPSAPDQALPPVHAAELTDDVGVKVGHVHVTVVTMTGQQLAAILPGDNHVSDLKAQISAKNGMPPLCQKLTLGSAVLRDGQKLMAVCRVAGTGATRTLNVSLALSLTPLKEHLRSAGTRKAKSADLSAIASLGLKAGSEGCEEIAHHALHDNDEVVRSHATSLLSGMCAKGYDQALECLTKLILGPWPRSSYPGSEARTALRVLAMQAFMKSTRAADKGSSAVYSALESEQTTSVWRAEEPTFGLSKVEAVHIVAGWMRENDLRATEAVFTAAGDSAADPRLRSAALSEMKRLEAGGVRARAARLAATVMEDSLHCSDTLGIGSAASELLAALAPSEIGHEILDALCRISLKPAFQVTAKQRCQACAHDRQRPIRCYACGGTGRVVDQTEANLARSQKHATNCANRLLAHLLFLGDRRVFPLLARGCCSQNPGVREQAWIALEECNGGLDWHAESGPEAVLARMLHKLCSACETREIVTARREAFRILREQEAVEASAAFHGDALRARRLSVRVRTFDMERCVVACPSSEISGFTHMFLKSCEPDNSDYECVTGDSSMTSKLSCVGGKWCVNIGYYNEYRCATAEIGDKPPEGRWLRSQRPGRDSCSGVVSAALDPPACIVWRLGADSEPSAKRQRL